VLNLDEGLNGARTSYFHHSLGGYHAAKPQRTQDLFEFHIYRNNRRVLDMLNVKYVIQADEEGNPRASLNPGALGNAWFVEYAAGVGSPDQAIQALDTLQVGRHAVVNTGDFPEFSPGAFAVDSTARVELVSYRPNLLEYRSENPEAGMLVFSEMYYPHGWQAYIDGTPAPHFRANYALRAMQVPSGSHQIVFKFEPKVIREGSAISLAASGLLAVLLLGAGGYELFRRKRQKH
jgi:hypothetical protein